MIRLYLYREIEAPAQGLLGRAWQIVRTTFLGVRVRKVYQGLEADSHTRELLSLAHESFPEVFDLFGVGGCYRLRQRGQMRVETAYKVVSSKEVRGITTYRHRRQLLDQVKWKIRLCNGGLEMLLNCSPLFLLELPP